MSIFMRNGSNYLTEKIEEFIKRNAKASPINKSQRDHDYSSEFKRDNYYNDSGNRKRTPNKDSFHHIEENAQQAIKMITSKHLTQMKLMIKPQQKIVYLGWSLLSMLAGVDSNISQDLLLLQDVGWADIHSYFLDVSSIMKTFSRFKDLLRMRKISLQHYKVSKMFLQKANEEDFEENKQQKIIVDIMETVLPYLHVYIKESYHPSYIKSKRCRSQLKTDQSNYLDSNNKINNIISDDQTNNLQNSSNQLCQQFEDDQQEPNQELQAMERTPTKMTYKDGQFRNSKPNSQRSSLNESSPRVKIRCHSIKKMDLQSRVQIAQQSKLSRLERILMLRVKKPIVESHFSQEKQSSLDKNDQSKPIDQKILYLNQIQKNKKEIRAILREESNFNWQIEREVKQIQKNDSMQKLQDDINRYKLIHYSERIEFTRETNPLKGLCQGNKNFANKENYSSLIQGQSNSKFQKRELVSSQSTQAYLSDTLLQKSPIIKTKCPSITRTSRFF